MSTATVNVGEIVSANADTVPPTPPNSQRTEVSGGESDAYDSGNESDVSCVVIINRNDQENVSTGRISPPVTLADITHAMGLSIRLTPEEIASQEAEQRARDVAQHLAQEKALVELHRATYNTAFEAGRKTTSRNYPFVVTDHDGPWLADVAYGFVPKGPLEQVSRDADTWYSVTTGKFVGVLTSNARAVKAVNGVSGGTMEKFKSQYFAVSHFNETLEDGMVSVVA